MPAVPAPSAAPCRAARTRDRGFTLIELLVVIIIIGILSAIAVPVFMNQRQKASDASVKADLHQLSMLVTAQGVETGKFPITSELDAAGAVMKTSPNVHVSVVWATTTDYCLVATNSKSGKDTSGLGAYVGVTTRLWTQSGTSGPVLATSPSTAGCLGTGSPSSSNGWYNSAGYHAGAY